MDIDWDAKHLLDSEADRPPYADVLGSAIRYFGSRTESHETLDNFIGECAPSFTGASASSEHRLEHTAMHERYLELWEASMEVFLNITLPRMVYLSALDLCSLPTSALRISTFKQAKIDRFCKWSFLSYFINCLPPLEQILFITFNNRN